MVRGKPYISIKRATKKASKIPRDRQLSLLIGLRYPTVKKEKRKMLKITIIQLPYAYVSNNFHFSCDLLIPRLVRDHSSNYSLNKSVVD